MEPATIATIVHFALALAKNCFKLAQNISRIKRVDDVVDSLGKEINGLKYVLDNVKKLGESSSESLDGPGNKHLENVEWSLVECQGTLEKLHKIFENVNKTSRRPIFRPWKQVKLEWNGEEIIQLRGAVTSCRHRIEIDLMMITGYHSGLLC
jgi:hypothetical protein